MGFFSFFFSPLFSAGFSFDLNWEKFLVHSDLLHGTLTATGCAEELSTVSLAAVKVGISLSLDLPSFGLGECWQKHPHVKGVFLSAWNSQGPSLQAL